MVSDSRFNAPQWFLAFRLVVFGWIYILPQNSRKQVLRLQQLEGNLLVVLQPRESLKATNFIQPTNNHWSWFVIFCRHVICVGFSCSFSLGSSSPNLLHLCVKGSYNESWKTAAGLGLFVKWIVWGLWSFAWCLGNSELGDDFKYFLLFIPNIFWKWSNLIQFDFFAYFCRWVGEKTTSQRFSLEIF